MEEYYPQIIKLLQTETRILDLCCRYGYVRIILYLLSLGLRFDYDEALSEACFNGNLELTQLFLNLGVSDQFKNYSLCLAARHGHLEMIQLLIQNGAEISGAYWKNPMLIALENGHIQTFKYLIKQGAQLTSQMISLSIELGLDLEISPEDRQRCLSYAIRNGSREIVNYLLDSGAQITLDIQSLADRKGFSLVI